MLLYINTFCQKYNWYQYISDEVSNALVQFLVNLSSPYSSILDHLMFLFCSTAGFICMVC